MKKFLAIVKKESLVLIRDWPGLLTLFVMPAILLILITLMQESVILKEESGIKIIIVNNDSSILGDTIINDIKKARSFNITRFSSVKDAEKAVVSGSYQLAVIIPDSVSYAELEKVIKKGVNNNLFNGCDVFDIYQGEHVQDGFKSVACRIRIQDVNATLTDEMIETQMANVRNTLKKSFTELSFRE